MSVLILSVMAVALATALFVVWTRAQQAAQAEYIRTYMFPPGLFEKLRAKRPELAIKDCQLIAHGLRQFFLAHLKSGCKFVSMPSQVADDLWHEFILYTRHYDAFCNKAFRRFMHHTPAVVLGPNRQDNEGLRRTWWYSCLEDNINPRKPTRMPLLFALDAKLKVPNGFVYAPDCEALRKSGVGTYYCGGDFSSCSYDGCTDGFGDSDSAGSGDAGGSGGDSGSSCGGGGCGGGGCGGD